MIILTDLRHRKFFSQRAENWSNSETIQKLKHLQKLFYDLDITLEGNILDVGCGTGVLVPFILDKSLPGSSLFELDFSTEMLRKNRRRWQSNSEFVSQINADTYLLPFDDNQFNIIICFAVLPHLPDKLLAISEWRRVLVSGGQLLILHLMSSKLLNEFHSKADNIIAQDFLPPIEKTTNMIKKSGFKIKISMERDDLYLILCEK